MRCAATASRCTRWWRSTAIEGDRNIAFARNVLKLVSRPSAAPARCGAGGSHHVDHRISAAAWLALGLGAAACTEDGYGYSGVSVG
jgi:hypothetical protein